MHVSLKGMKLIKHFEGLFLETYVDPVGVDTIGYGHTGEHATPGNKITESDAEKILQEDLVGHEAAVDKHVNVPLEQYQFDALVSFAFNVGNSAFFNSTLRRKLNDGDYEGAADELPRWNKGTVKGKKVELPGLTRRRRSERHLFLTGELDYFDGRNVIDPDDDERELTHRNDAMTGNYAQDLNARLAEWGISHFSAAELMELGALHSSPNSPAYGKNSLPPRALWDNMQLTVKTLDELRKALGQPIHILSAYRNDEYNRLVGGAPKSQHLNFNALDFYASGPTRPSHWASLLKDMRSRGDFKGGIGIYSSFVHLDTRGTNANW